jgi:PPOX class probable F420-dependent enzyme
MPSTHLSKLPTWATELLDSAPVARLGLLDSDQGPRVLPVTFAIASGAIWSAIDRKPKSTPEPARLSFLRDDPRVALTVDHYSDDWDELAWVQVLGRVEILDASDAADGMAALAAKYEPYRDTPPPGPVLRLDPRRSLYWRAWDA